MTEKSLLFLGTEDDRSYLPALKPHLKGHKCFVDTRPVSTIAEVEMYATHATRNITGVISTSESLLRRFTGKEKSSLDAYSGSYFKRNGIEYVFVNPLEQVNTVPYGKFLLERFTSKLVSPENWLRAPTFNWTVLTPQNCEKEYATFADKNVLAIAIDIETLKQNLAIRCVGYTCIIDTGDGFSSRSIVIPLTDEWSLRQVRRFNSTNAPKIFQNGKYDCSYLLRYDAAPFNYLWDTANLFHSYYSELPKDLAFLQSFFVREAAYWKDLAESSDLETYYLYNAKDTWATACAFLGWMLEAPQWAHKNYTLEFPLTFPCLLSEMTGVLRNKEARSRAIKEIDETLERKRASMDRMLGVKGFNPNSTKQVGTVFKLLGCGDLPGTGDKEMAKAIYRHPLNRRILSVIRGVPKTDNVDLMGLRAMRKMKSTYLADGTFKNSKGEIIADKDFKGRMMYSLNPHHTDTSRLASGEHHFWCGANVQNIPVGKTVKQTVVADEGFWLAECDLEQAETRDTAYITGDKNLLSAVNSTRDFHSHNVEAFFGIPYIEVYDDRAKKVLRKDIRNIGKRVNHGANYNMGPDVLVDTMGEEAIYEAARILKLPRGWTAREIAQHLLAGFDKTYPVIRGDYHVWVINQIAVHHKLVGALGWTRWCFSNPKGSKPALNAYVAHNPQSLNAQVLNKAVLSVYYDIAMHPEHRRNFKLLAQIHDSIFFQYRDGHEYLAEMVKERMEIPVTIKDIKGVERTFTVPAALKLGTVNKETGVLTRAKYWHQTE